MTPRQCPNRLSVKIFTQHDPGLGLVVGAEMVPNINGPYITFMDHCACSGTDEAHTELLAQRDALLAALHEMLGGFVDSYCHNDPDYSRAVQEKAIKMARAAIARATTGTTATTEKP